jgi:hypothetical protein
VYAERDRPDELPENLQRDWDDSLNKLKNQLENEKDEAKDRWIKRPGYSGELWRMTYEPKEEDDPTFHIAHQALTRLTGPSVSVICLFRADGMPCLDSTLQRVVDLVSCPDMPMVKELLKKSIIVSHRGLVHQLTAEGDLVPEKWRESPLLRHHYLLYFNEQRRCSFGGYELCLDRELGLTIDKKES